jgi:hypothetical protein
MAVSFIGGGNQNAIGKFYHIMYREHLAMSMIRTRNLSGFKEWRDMRTFYSMLINLLVK